ncbi:MAG: hypothetical protein ACO1OB_34680 [Archangium sp.]
MREEDIQRYGRQILLKELGGRGQAKLMARAVQVHGSGETLDDAVSYLRLGGTPIGAVDEAVQLAKVGTQVAGDAVLVGAGVAWRSKRACDDCWALTSAALPETPEAPLIVGSVAALAVQRLILGWAESLGLFEWNGERLAPREPIYCPGHR